MAGRKVALTEGQKQARVRYELGRLLIDLMNAGRGIQGLGKDEFARKMGKDPDTWRRWNDDKEPLRGAKFHEVIGAAQAAGLKVIAHKECGKVIVEVSL